MVKSSAALMINPYTATKERLSRRWRKTLTTCKRHPFATALFVIVAYFVVAQTKFTFSGDTWAEGYVEYLSEAIQRSWLAVFNQSWAGYLTIVPSFLVKAFVAWGGAIGYIDYFYHGVVLIFVALSAAFVASKFNRTLIKNDFVRIFFALALVMLLVDVSSFSFINVWYVGFVVIALICLNPARLSVRQEITYTIYGILLALTKPVLIIAPFLIYRAIKTRQFVSNGLILAATLGQGYLIFFMDPREVVQDAAITLEAISGAMFTGAGVELLKLLQIYPQHIVYVIVANVVLVALFVWLWRVRGIWVALLLGVGYLYSVYTYVMAPDAPAYQSMDRFVDVYKYNLKTQREIIGNGFLLLTALLLVPTGLKLLKKFMRRWPYALFVVVIILAVGLFSWRLYRPIDVESAGVAGYIEPFRHSLNTNQSVCVSLPPTPIYYFEANWYFGNRGGCYVKHHNPVVFKPLFNNMNVPLHQNQRIVIESNHKIEELKTIVVPIRNTNPSQPDFVYLRDLTNGTQYRGNVYARANEDIQFVAFNLAGMNGRDLYEFVLYSNSHNLYTGRFENKPGIIFYDYYIGWPNYQNTQEFTTRFLP